MPEKISYQKLQPEEYQVIGSLRRQDVSIRAMARVRGCSGATNGEGIRGRLDRNRHQLDFPIVRGTTNIVQFCITLRRRSAALNMTRHRRFRETVASFGSSSARRLLSRRRLVKTIGKIAGVVGPGGLGNSI